MAKSSLKLKILEDTLLNVPHTMEAYDQTKLEVDVLIHSDLLRILWFDSLNYHIHHIDYYLYIYYFTSIYEELESHNQILFPNSKAL